MPYVTAGDLLRSARAGRYAVGAFNIENMEMAQAVVTAAEELRAPVMLATTPGTLKYAPPAVFCGIVRALADGASVPVALHLDHGDSLETVEAGLNAGYSSVMIDGSRLPFEDNVALARRAVALARPFGAPVEAELGRVGGKEDDREDDDPGYTDPEQAAAFVRATGVDSLAVAIGTAHGVYRVPPRLDVARLSAVRAVVDVPLVLHGTSGLADGTVRDCIARGVCKVNYATELRQAFTAALRRAVAGAAGFDPKLFLRPAGEAVRALARERILLCGSANRA